MSRYIDADLFVAYMKGVKERNELRKRILFADEDDIIRAIEAQPTANVVEQTRCKDCRYNYANIIPNGSGCSNNVELKAEAEWYCADGERDE